MAQKQIQGSNFRIETRLDVNSSFEGLVSASTGVWIEKKLGVIDSNFYIQVCCSGREVSGFYFKSGFYVKTIDLDQ